MYLWADEGTDVSEGSGSFEVKTTPAASVWSV